MAYIMIDTLKGPRKVLVCDYCKTVCIPYGRFCSGYCALNYRKRVQSWTQPGRRNRGRGSDT